MKNQVQLITYVDRLSGGGFLALQDLLEGPLRRLFGGVHLWFRHFPNWKWVIIAGTLG